MSNKDHQPRDIVELLIQLEQATQLKGKGKAIKKTFQITGSEKNLVSWKFNEWDYGKDKIKLPSNARGLFTLEDGPVLAVRGYDKFFNIDEVGFTRWDWLAKNTKGPYHVTSKENGCIILVAGLQDGTLVVCSKHSTGSREDVDRNHATSGQDFLREQLRVKGITEKEFALKLYELNVTAVCEYCDDDFEEHIVEYKGEDSGLYLHGLNLNKPIFETYPIDKVNEFAAHYGFKIIDYFTEPTIESLKLQLEEYSKVGSYKGKEIEGFVIRCKLHNDEDYFFKFKFEEPYLMYRQWREATRTYINNRDRTELKFSKHKFITNKYLDFVIPILDSDPQLCADYLVGKGQIELRQRFLTDYGMTGSEILNQERIEELETLNAFDRLKIDEDSRFAFVPIATIGCGKTTTSMTLTNLFPDRFDIVINDNLPKQNKGLFIKQPLEILKTKKAVFLDRNNHQYRERKQIFEDFAKLRDDYLPYNTNLQFVALNFIADEVNEDELWNATTERVFARGDNHQSIKAATDGKKKVESIMSGFIKRFQPVNPSREPDSQFDFIIDMKVGNGNTSLENAIHIINEINKKYPILIPEVPPLERIEAAFQKALQYKPTYIKNMGHSKKDKVRKPIYFSISIDNIPNLLSEVSQTLLSKNKSQFFENLQLNKRTQEEFHVTLAHITQSKVGTEADKQTWKHWLKAYENINNKDSSPPSKLNIKADIKLKHIVFDQKALALHVELIRFYNAETMEVLDLKVMNKFPHITIGTAAPSIKPFYSNQLLTGLEVYGYKEGQFDDFNVIQWDHDVVLENLDVIANF